jgi:hypothetical protein
MKLNLGCGFDIRPGWLNVDLHAWHKPDLVCDVTHLHTLEDAVAGHILAQDILEHIHRERCLTALQEWNRVLKMGGLLEVRVPDVLAVADLMRRPEHNTVERHHAMLHCLFGSQGYEGDFHFNGFTELTLKDNLEQSGFELAMLKHKDEWLFDVLAKKVRHQPPPALLRLASNEAFVDQAYQSILGRAPDDEGKAYALRMLASGMPREVIVAQLRRSDEGRARQLSSAGA